MTILEMLKTYPIGTKLRVSTCMSKTKWEVKNYIRVEDGGWRTPPEGEEYTIYYPEAVFSMHLSNSIFDFEEP